MHMPPCKTLYLFIVQLRNVYYAVELAEKKTSMFLKKLLMLILLWNSEITQCVSTTVNSQKEIHPILAISSG